MAGRGRGVSCRRLGDVGMAIQVERHADLKAIFISLRCMSILASQHQSFPSLT